MALCPKQKVKDIAKRTLLGEKKRRKKCICTLRPSSRIIGNHGEAAARADTGKGNGPRHERSGSDAAHAKRPPGEGRRGGGGVDADACTVDGALSAQAPLVRMAVASPETI